MSSPAAGSRSSPPSSGIHRDTVHNILERQGVLRPRGLQPDELLEAIRLYQDGWSLGRLATEFDVSPSTVNRALRQAGVPIRRPGPPRGIAPRSRCLVTPLKRSRCAFWVRAHPGSVSGSANRAREAVWRRSRSSPHTTGCSIAASVLKCSPSSYLLAGPRAYCPASSATTGASASAKSAPKTK